MGCLYIGVRWLHVLSANQFQNDQTLFTSSRQTHHHLLPFTSFPLFKRARALFSNWEGNFTSKLKVQKRVAFVNTRNTSEELGKISTQRPEKLVRYTEQILVYMYITEKRRGKERERWRIRFIQRNLTRSVNIDLKLWAFHLLAVYSRTVCRGERELLTSLNRRAAAGRRGQKRQRVNYSESLESSIQIGNRDFAPNSDAAGISFSRLSGFRC